MNNLQYMIPERNMYMKIGRILIIISKLALSTKGTRVLDTEKLVVFEFLTRYPNILKELKILNADRDTLFLIDYEIDNIDSKFPNNYSLYNYNDLQQLLKILVYYKFIEVQFNKNKVYYSISTKGNNFINELNTPYLQRVIELCNAMLSMRSVNSTKLKQMIRSIMEGMENE